MSVVTVSDVSRKTTRNYKALVASTNNATTTVNVLYKLGIRHTSDNNIISTSYYLMVVTSTHFFIGEKKTLYHKKKISEASNGSIKFRQFSK